MSGSAGRKRDVGLRLIVAALTLFMPAILLAYGLLTQPFVSATPIVDETIATEAVVALSPDDELAAASQPPATEAVATATAAAEQTMLPTPRSTPLTTPTPQPSWVGPPTFTFVALGVDQRDEKEIPRTDTIMIGRVDLRAPKVSLVSVPRDLLVDIPGYGKDRINTAYVYGEQFKEPGGGIGLLKKTIEKNLGIQVDHFGLVDFQCFRTAVDSVGGVTVNVPRSIVDTQYPTEDYGTKIVKFEPGMQRMDGERALEYARTRYADNDFQRIQRQQLIIAAMRDQLLQLRTLPSVPTLLTGCRNMRSDLGWREYLTLATTLQSIQSNRISFATIDERMTVDSTLASGAAVLLPRWEPIRALIAETFNPAPSATTRAGAAVASPTPTLPAASPSPLPFASPYPMDPSVAGPPPLDGLPEIPPAVGTPVAPVARLP